MSSPENIETPEMFGFISDKLIELIKKLENAHSDIKMTPGIEERYNKLYLQLMEDTRLLPAAMHDEQLMRKLNSNLISHEAETKYFTNLADKNIQ